MILTDHINTTRPAAVVKPLTFNPVKIIWSSCSQRWVQVTGNEIYCIRMKTRHVVLVIIVVDTMRTKMYLIHYMKQPCKDMRQSERE